MKPGAMFTARQRSSDEPRRAHIVLAGVCCALAACASTIQGAQEPPTGWEEPVVSIDECDALSGTYSAVGEPALENAHAWPYTIVWPTQGSLISLIATGMNGGAMKQISAVRVRADSGGIASFDALNEKAGTVPHGLGATEWWCEEGKLVTRAVIDTGPDSFGSGEHDESYVRLWKSPDGSLIAESTFRAIRTGRFGTAVERQPLARFYFRFPEASPSE